MKAPRLIAGYTTVDSPRFRNGASRRYSATVKPIWQGRAAQVVTKYGEQAPMAAVCCNACRTCVTTNVVGLATGALAAAGYAAVRFARRVTRAA